MVLPLFIYFTSIPTRKKLLSYSVSSPHQFLVSKDGVTCHQVEYGGYTRQGSRNLRTESKVNHVGHITQRLAKYGKEDVPPQNEQHVEQANTSLHLAVLEEEDVAKSNGRREYQHGKKRPCGIMMVTKRVGHPQVELPEDWHPCS